MIVVAIVSAKGGVGKTTLTANLGVGIAQRGNAVLIVDMDPQNAMQWHLGGIGDDSGDGICTLFSDARELDELVYRSPLGVDFIPFGKRGERHRIEFEDMLEEQSDWLSAKLREAALSSDTIVLLDTPPGPSVYLKQAIRAADFLLVVLLADAASFATVAEMESLIAAYGKRGRSKIASAYLVNQETPYRLAQDIIAVLRGRLGRRLIPLAIPESDQVAEALAFEKPVISYSPDNVAAQSMQKLADWLLQLLYARSEN